MSGPLTSPDAFLRALFDRAVAVADPMRSLAAYLPPKPAGRVVVVGAGKASARMAEAVETAWGPCDPRHNASGGSDVAGVATVKRCCTALFVVVFGRNRAKPAKIRQKERKKPDRPCVFIGVADTMMTLL